LDVGYSDAYTDVYVSFSLRQGTILLAEEDEICMRSLNFRLHCLDPAILPL